MSELATELATDLEWLRAGQPIEARAKNLNRARTTLRWVWAVLRLVAAWWTLWPALALAVIATPVSLAAVAPLALVGWWRWPWFRNQLGLARHRTLTVLFGLWWPKACSRAAVVGIIDRHVRSPRLVAATFGPGLVPSWVRITLQPLATQPPVWWSNIADRLARELGYSTSTFHQGDERRSDMVLTLRRHVLPTRIELGTDIAATIIGRDSDQVILGESAAGGTFGWCPGEAGRANLILAGSQGGGKGNLARLVLIHAGRCEWDAIVLNPKRVGEFNWARHFASICHTTPGMHAAIAYAVEEMERRALILNDLDVDQITDLDPTTQQTHGLDRRLVLIVDEIATLVAKRGPTREDQAAWAQAMAGLAQLASMGRACGVSMVICPQHPIADNLGPNGLGSTLKANINARIGTGNLEPEAVRILFGAGDETNALALAGGRPGRCRYKGLTHNDGPRDIVGQAYLAHQSTAAALTATASRPVTDFDTLSVAVGPDTA